MTRRASILAYCLVIALGLLGLQSWDVAVGRVEQRVIAAIEERTGLVLTGMERAEIALLPLPRINLVGVSFRHRDGDLAGNAVRLKARARLLPLLAGSISFDRVDLFAPRIDVDAPDGGEASLDWLSAPLAGLEKLDHQSRIVIVAGSVSLRRQGQTETIVRDLNLVVDAREPSEPLDLSGSLTWRDVPTDVALVWPMATGRGRVMLSASSALAKLRFEGTRSSPADGVIAGQVSLTAPSLPDLLQWFGEQPRLAAATNGLSVTADALVKPHEISLSGLSVALDGDRLDGALKLSDAGGRLALAGTLAGAQLDIGRMLARLPLRDVATADAQPLAFDAWTAQDIDLRVSVDAARLNGARLSDVATYLLVKKGRFEAGLLRAGLYGGTAKGRFLASSVPTGVDVKLQGGLDKVNFAQLASDAPPLRASGTGGFQFNLDGVGTSTNEILSSLSGKAALALRQGEIGGLALAELLRRAETGPLAALRSDWRKGRTPFDSFTGNAVVVGGLALLNETTISGPGYRATLDGAASLATRSLDVTAELMPSSGHLRLPLRISGPVDEPTVELEMRALLSPAGTATRGSP